MIMRLGIILLCLFNLHGYSQEKIIYKGDAMNFIYINPKTSQIVSTIPKGKNVELIYNVFFKRWNIYYENEAGSRSATQWLYLQDAIDGGVIMTGPNDSKVQIIDRIVEYGKLMVYLIDEKMANGLEGRIEFTGVVLKETK